MKKIIISVLALILIIGIIISINLFVKNQQIQESLKDVAESEFVQDDGSQNLADVASNITIDRKDGQWSVSQTGEYSVDPESLEFTFTGYKIGGEHTGTFNEVVGFVALDDQGQPVSLALSISPSSVQTDSEAVDKHLQDGVFFDTTQYPEVVVAVRSFEDVTDVSASAITDITIKGITKTLRIPVAFEKAENGTAFTLDTKIKISEWNMSFGPVLDDVRVMLEGTIVKN